MARHLNLRQIEAFKAVIENGTVSRGAELLNISQPSMSKLISHLEYDTGLKLFDRLKGRLAPTEDAMRLYEEVERIFSGMRQVENIVDAIRREKQGRLAVGVIPALSGRYIRGATTDFLKNHPQVFCSVQSLSSGWIVDAVIARKLDVGLVSASADNPFVILEPLMEHPLVCIMPLGHPLAGKSEIRPEDLDQLPFVAFNPDTFMGHAVEMMFGEHEVRPEVVLISNATPIICEFVADGLGVALVHPLMASGLENRLVARRFAPDILYNFKLCRNADSRNAKLVDAFTRELTGRTEQVRTALFRN
jgi:DNA-binding transcriptional LysR family regulator